MKFAILCQVTVAAGVVVVEVVVVAGEVLLEVDLSGETIPAIAIINIRPKQQTPIPIAILPPLLCLFQNPLLPFQMFH